MYGQSWKSPSDQKTLTNKKWFRNLTLLVKNVLTLSACYFSNLCRVFTELSGLCHFLPLKWRTLEFYFFAEKIRKIEHKLCYIIRFESWVSPQNATLRTTGHLSYLYNNDKFDHKCWYILTSPVRMSSVIFYVYKCFFLQSPLQFRDHLFGLLFANFPGTSKN